MMYEQLIKPLLFKLDAETAHEQALKVASLIHQKSWLQELVSAFYGPPPTGLEKELFGVKFPGPVGLAAGFDKNGTTPLAIQALGFGFVEVGSITANPSGGNPKPRAFRLPKDGSLINRMGLNNEGADAITHRLSSLKTNIPLGINIAKTNDASIHGDAALQDYLHSYQKALPVADYITVNISCPNTGEGKTFEDPKALDDLLATLEPGAAGRKPTLVKITVDINQHALANLVDICEQHGVAGYVATNTSSQREGLQTPGRELQEIGNGGLSGRAIRDRSTQVVRWLHEITEGNKPIIGVGGIDSAEAAVEKVKAGADLVQVYTGLIYQGPGLVSAINKRMLELNSSAEN